MKPSLLLTALFAATVCTAGRPACTGVAGSTGHCLQQATLNGGGATSVSPVGTTFRLTASLGQESAIGVSAAANHVLQSGFWSYYGSGLVPVVLMVHKNSVTPADPELSWTGNNSPYSLYRLSGATGSACATLFNNLLTTQAPQTYTDAATPAEPLTCYSVLATAPGP
jgi:hypothetical protein